MEDRGGDGLSAGHPVLVSVTSVCVCERERERVEYSGGDGLFTGPLLL